MSATTTITTQNRAYSDSNRLDIDLTRTSTRDGSQLQPTEELLQDTEPPPNAFEVVPDGGLQAWTQVMICAVFMFWTNGWATSWGVIQTALLQSTKLEVEPSTLSFVGSLGIGCCVAFGLVSIRIIRAIGARWTCAAASLLMGSGTILASVALDNIGGLFCTAGVMFGIGSCVLFSEANLLPVHWFSRRLGVSSGIVKAGGGVGGTVLPIASQKMIDAVGIAWTFRIFGFLMLVTAIPCALMIKERRSGAQASRIQWTLLKDVSFLCLCLGGAVTVWALFVPPFFLPLLAQSIGLSPTIGAGLVAGFGLSSTTGRFISGFTCDKIGPINTLFITLMVNATSMLALWPLSGSKAPLMTFAVINGIANGSFFASTPIAISRLAGPEYAQGAMTIGISFWTPGYLLGASVAGILITKTGARTSSSIKAYWAAIFYAGGVATLGAVLICIAKLKRDRKLLKKL